MTIRISIFTCAFILFVFGFPPLVLSCHNYLHFAGREIKGCVSDNNLHVRLITSSALLEFAPRGRYYRWRFFERHNNPNIFLVGFEDKGAWYFIEKVGNHFEIIRRSSFVFKNVRPNDSRWFERDQTGRNSHKYRHVASRSYVAIENRSNKIVATKSVNQATSFCIH